MVPALSMNSSDPIDAPDALSTILAQAALGEESAWVELVELYSRRVFAMARSRLHDDELAEEITQSVFVTLASKLTDSSYTEQNRFEPWLFRITMNRVRDYCRKRSRHARPTAPEVFSSIAGKADDDLADRSEMQNQLDQMRVAMEQLGDSDRQLIELRHHGQLSFKQIAQITGDPIGTLLARHHRALKKLRNCIDSTKGSETQS